jgi:hypothetical protein
LSLQFQRAVGIGPARRRAGWALLCLLLLTATVAVSLAVRLGGVAGDPDPPPPPPRTTDNAQLPLLLHRHYPPFEPAPAVCRAVLPAEWAAVLPAGEVSLVGFSPAVKNIYTASGEAREAEVQQGAPLVARISVYVLDAPALASYCRRRVGAGGEAACVQNHACAEQPAAELGGAPLLWQWSAADLRQKFSLPNEVEGPAPPRPAPPRPAPPRPAPPRCAGERALTRPAPTGRLRAPGGRPRRAFGPCGL